MLQTFCSKTKSKFPFWKVKTIQQGNVKKATQQYETGKPTIRECLLPRKMKYFTCTTLLGHNYIH